MLIKSKVKIKKRTGYHETYFRVYKKSLAGMLVLCIGRVL